MLTRWEPPSGPGVRLDSGYLNGQTVPGAYDSLVAKLVVSGASRTEALERSRRALAEFVVEGMPTVIPFHRAVVSDPAFVGDGDHFSVHTRWIETEFDNRIEKWSGPSVDGDGADVEVERLVFEVDGRRIEVGVPAGVLGGGGRPAAKPSGRKRSGGGRGTAAVSGDALTSPMQGTIVKVAVSDGAKVAAGDLVVVLEAMKMEQPLTAHRAGTVTGLTAEIGATVTAGAVICEIKD